ncbi:hypothetical protein MRB53_024499 [Persea americana]|uniref:Uncharacterized protein n=1 Tax=Persea americana TaxID=3435 RepID=A0ACC2LD99_PERAE|nr:hypothetical protein MRB53_024499 [Persea americana]
MSFLYAFFLNYYPIHSIFSAISVYFSPSVFLTQYSVRENRPSIINIHPAVEDTEIVLKKQHLKRPSITNIQQVVGGSPLKINI